MTTIATDGKVVSADGRITAEYIESDSAIKIFELRVGETLVEIFGTRGDADLGTAYVDWHSGGRDPDRRPEWPPEAVDGDFFEALHLTRDGKVYWVGGYNFAKVEVSAPMAIGSGGNLARAAMLLGKSPQEAVAFAAQYDPHTGGKILTLGFADEAN